VLAPLHDLLIKWNNGAVSLEEVQQPIGKIKVDFSVIEFLQSPGLANRSYETNLRRVCDQLSRSIFAFTYWVLTSEGRWFIGRVGNGLIWSWLLASWWPAIDGRFHTRVIGANFAANFCIELLGQFNRGFDRRNSIPLLILVVVVHNSIAGVDSRDLIGNRIDYFNVNVDICIFDSDNSKFQKNKSDDLIANLTYIQRLIYKEIGVSILFALHQIIANFN
jgi:hypothetical protein